MTELTPAPSGHPIKLVRDKTPDIINSTGGPGALFYDNLPDDLERGLWLRKKLLEEVGEYLVEPNLEELADVLAVVEGLAAWHGISLKTLTSVANQDARGGFLTGKMMRGYHREFDGVER